MTVDELLDRMSSAEFQAWKALYLTEAEEAEARRPARQGPG